MHAAFIASAIMRLSRCRAETAGGVRQVRGAAAAQNLRSWLGAWAIACAFAPNASIPCGVAWSSLWLAPRKRDGEENQRNELAGGLQHVQEPPHRACNGSCESCQGIPESAAQRKL